MISKPIFNLKLLTILIVTITSEEGQHFKGFLLEARTNYDKEEAIGVWETRVKNTKTLDCFDNEDVTKKLDFKSSLSFKIGNVKLLSIEIDNFFCQFKINKILFLKLVKFF